MPLPIGHSLMGYALAETTSVGRDGSRWKMLLLFVIVSNLPDFDFLFGFFLNDPNRFHRHFISHSIGTSVLVGVACGLYFRFVQGKRFTVYCLTFAAVCFSHVALDTFSVDHTYPFGVPMFWPFSDTYFMSPVPLFMSVQKGGDSLSFIRTLFVEHNLLAALWEFIIFVPVLLILKAWKSRKGVVGYLHQKRMRFQA